MGILRLTCQVVCGTEICTAPLRFDGFNHMRHARTTSVLDVIKQFLLAWDMSLQFLVMHPTYADIGITHAGPDASHKSVS